jgi:alcohol dehydrogenase
MAFAKRKLPIVIGAEAAGTIVTAGPGVALKAGQVVALFGAETCGHCQACREGRDNFCENVAGIRGFHVDGLARERITLAARLVVPAPAGVSVTEAACAPITYGTVEHMLFDNAHLQAGQTVLIQAGGSGIGTAAIQLAKAAGATVFTTVSTADKAAKAKALGADHVINYKEERFEGVVRKLTAKQGVDVVFEHVGPDTFQQSMFAMKRGGVLVTCGSTTGVSSEINLFQLYQRQLRLIGSFGCNLRNLATVLDKMAAGIARPVIDSVIALADIDAALARLESRNVFGKILVTL